MSAINEVMYGKITRLSHVFRYSAQPVIARESVAEHSFWTAMIGVTLSYEIGKPEIAGSVALQSVVHDIEECMTGDLVRDMKYANPDFRKQIKEVEEKFVDNLLVDMGTTGKLLKSVWARAKDNTWAGRIVQVSDALSVISFCTREYELGNLGLRDIRNSCINLIRKKIEEFGDTSGMDKLVNAIDEAVHESHRRMRA